MSSAYCMTCNDQVLDLAGSCPEGHPIGAEDTSPQPWVGHADASGRGTPASPPPPPAAQPAAQAQPVAEAANGNGHANGHAHAKPAAAQVTSFTPSDVDEMGGRAVHRAPANGEAADELAAMLASALASTPTGDRPSTNQPPPADTSTSDDLDAPWVGSAGDGADTPAASSGPVLPWTDEDLDDFLSGATSGTEPVTDATPVADATSAAPGTPEDDTSDRDWDDLASLAAELQLDGAASAPAAEAAPPPAPEAQLPDSLVDLPPPAPPTPAAPAPVAPAPAVPAVDMNDDLDTLSDQDLAALYESAVGQHLDEAEHVPSEPMTPPAPEAADTPAVTVDLANFTARGNSVARNSAAARRFGRKR